MAVISAASGSKESSNAAAYINILTSLGVMMCMIVSVMGIKLWWFKHRLTFDQNAASNGAAGGSRPAVVAPPPKRTSRNKRLSQQFHDADTVQGVFRKRTEDDLVIEPPKQLPPVRVDQKSLTLPLPRAGHSEFLMVPPPPTRQPPRPPIYETVESLPVSQSASLGSFQTPMAPPRTPPQIYASITPSTPTPASTPTTSSTPIYATVSYNYNNNNTNETKSLQEPSEHRSYEAAATKALDLDDDLMEREAFTPKPADRLDRSLSSEVPLSGRQKFLKAKTHSEPDNMRDLADRRPTGYLRPKEGNLREMQEQFGALSVDEFGERSPSDAYVRYDQYDVDGLDSVTEEWRRKHRDLSESPRFASEFDDESDRALSTTTQADGMRRGGGGESVSYEHSEEEVYWVSGYSGGEQFAWQERREKGDGMETVTKLVSFQLNDDDVGGEEDEDGYGDRNDSPMKTRRPTGYVRDADFDTVMQQRSVVTFASSELTREEEEDDQDDEDSPIKARRPTGYVRDPVDMSRSVTFSSSQLTQEEEEDEDDDEDSPIKARRPTGYVRDPVDMSRSVTFASSSLNTVNSEDDDEDGLDSPLKARRPTGYIRDPQMDASLSHSTSFSPQLPAHVDEEDDRYGRAADYERSVTFEAEDSPSREERLSPFQVRRATGYPQSREEVQFESDNDADDNEEREKHMWLEMSQQTGDNFADDVDEEFQRIRRSYDQTYGQFLDVDREFSKLHEEPERSAEEPPHSGYGKSIDEDWASFEELQRKRSSGGAAPPEQTSKVISFEANSWSVDTVEDEQSRSSELGPTSYQSVYDEAEFTGAYGAIESSQHFRFAAGFEEVAAKPSTPSAGRSILKDRRPTGYVRRADFELAVSESGAQSLEEYESPLPGDSSRPPATKQVTFDFQGNEVVEPESSPEMPRPMQRLTNIRYTEDVADSGSAAAESNSQMAASLFVSHEEVMMDSWSAIRQHRHLTEELQQLSLESSARSGEAREEEQLAPRMPMPRQLPKPAYRNPLAQLSGPAAKQEDEQFMEFGGGGGGGRDQPKGGQSTEA